MRKLSRVGTLGALKGACPVWIGAGRKPTAERQEWAPSFDQYTVGIIAILILLLIGLKLEKLSPGAS
jgi:hypothetical protein